MVTTRRSISKANQRRSRQRVGGLRKKTASTSNGQKAEVPERILSIDIGGSKIKLLVNGETEPRKLRTGKRMTPVKLVEAVRELTKGWDYEAISIGYPGLVGERGPLSEPGNLGPGWVGFDFAAVFGRPVRIVNDAAMQALGSYEGGRMLFLGLGTGLGSAFISNNVMLSLELGQVPFDDSNLGDVLGRAGMKRVGKKRWRDVIRRIVPALMAAFVADYVVLGGGNAKEVNDVPPGARLGHNLTAFRGGFRLWHLSDVPTLPQDPHMPCPNPSPLDWRVI